MHFLLSDAKKVSSEQLAVFPKVLMHFKPEVVAERGERVITVSFDSTQVKSTPVVTQKPI